MAETENKPNGTIGEDEMHIGVFDPNDPECQRQIWRPADIDQDMKEMDRRKRVDMIMNSQVFREELERIIESQINEGYLPAGLTALQQVTEILLPHTARSSAAFRSGHCVIPINDIRGVDGLRYTKGEKLLRCKLAAVYRLIDLYGWSENIYNHITVRVSQDQEYFLLNPFGLQYHEITASSLLKVDLQGNVIDPGTTHFSISRAGYVLHSAIHATRPDLKCIIHVHYPPCVAVASSKCGFLYMSQESAIIGNVSYHNFDGILISQNEKENIARDLGPVNKVMFLRNHGVVACGESIEQAMFLMNNVVAACEAQIRVMPIGIENIQIISDEARQKVHNAVWCSNNSSLYGKDESDDKEKAKRLRIWDMEFEAEMRMLDNVGFRTGYIYRHPLIRSELPRQKNDVEVPPSASSAAQYFEDDKWLSPLKKLMDGKKTHDKMRWVNSPNVYQKVEVLETGTTDPKKITKWVELQGNGDSDSWVQEGGSPSHSTPVKIDSPHQFIPKSGDPSEFKKKQKEIKENRMNAKITAGPQSQLLEGVTWEEIRKMQDASMSGTGDQVVLVGAASKGIIQRDYQHNAMVYKSAYSKNPFDNISDQELEEYKRIVERKQRGESVEEDIPDEIKPWLMEPVAVPEHQEVISSSVEESKSPPISPVSPYSDEEDMKSGASLQRSLSARLAAEEASESQRVEAAEEERNKHSFERRVHSERKPKRTSDTAVNGEDKLRSVESGGDMSGASRSSKESSPVKEVSGDSPKKDKKKKKGLRTPSFLKKKKHKKEKEDKEKASSEV